MHVFCCTCQKFVVPLQPKTRFYSLRSHTPHKEKESTALVSSILRGNGNRNEECPHRKIPVLFLCLLLHMSKICCNFAADFKTIRS